MSRLLVVCDLDGTLTFAPRRPDAIVLDALRLLAESDGVRLTIATARSARTVHEWFPDMPALAVISCNGALTQAPAAAGPRYLPERSLAIALRRLARAGVDFCLEHGSHFVATRRDALPWMGEAHRFVLPEGARPDVRRVLKCSVADAAAAHRAAAWLPGLAVVPHASGDADLMATRVSKAAAVARLRTLGERVIAFGNDDNDRGMLERADVSYVVGDLMPELDRREHVRRVDSDPACVAAALLGSVAGRTAAHELSGTR